MTDRVTLLGYVLMSLLCVEPRSGYALRRAVAALPSAPFSSSPGSLYPALGTLTRAGLITQRTVKAKRNSKPLFRLSPSGQDALTQWLAYAVTPAELKSGQAAAMVRFEMLGLLKEWDLMYEFLTRFEAAARTEAADLKRLADALAAQADEAVALMRVRHAMLMLETGALWAAHARGSLPAQT